MEERPQRHLRANRGKNPNARWLVDEPIKKPAPKRRKPGSKASPAAKKAAKPKPEVMEGDTRCKCEGEVPDDKTMAECENCSTWQHIVCEYGVDDESALPETYLCYQCREPEDQEPNEDKVKSEESDSQISSKNGDSNQSEKGEPKDSDEKSPIEAIEDKVRRSVAEAWLRILTNISKENKEIKADILTKSIELENALFDAFCGPDAKEVSQPYREQFRMLCFNLKDTKNQKLQRSVLSGAIPAKKFVSMSSEDLRNPELQKMAHELHEESIRESIIEEVEPPKEKVSMSTGEVNAEPSETAVEKEEQRNELDLDKAMREPLGPAPPAPAPTADQANTDASEPEAPAAKTIEKPVWEGKVKLSDNSIEFNGKGMFLSSSSEHHNVQRDEWQKYLDEDLVIHGLVQVDRATEYFKASAAEQEHHRVAALAVTTDKSSRTSLSALYDYFKKLDRLGSIKASKPNVKDAFLIPWDEGFDLSFLQIDADARGFLNHLKTEHGNGKVLVALYVLNTL